jgi:hypothetical protein
MTKHAMLNNVDHRSLRIETRHGAQYGDDIMCVMAVPSEFLNVVADYPIFFSKSSETGKYLPMAMFGFERGENLFLEEDKWNATYIPLMVRRGPFAIGFQNVTEGTRVMNNMVISVDMDHPRVGASDGEPVFQPFGDNSDYTDQIVEVLKEIESGQTAGEQFVDALLEHDLLEPFSLDVRLDSGDRYSLQGFYTIQEEKLAALDGQVLADFSRRGILQACYMVIASMANIARLIELKNKRA